jgi:hypothetical protein
VAPPARLLQACLVALGAIGIISIFLSFTRTVAPFDLIVLNAPDILAWRLPNRYDIWLILLASPFWLAIPITAASLKRLWTGRLSRVAWLTFYWLALVMAGATLGFVGLALTEKPLPTDTPLEEYLVLFSPQEYFALLLPLFILVFGAGWLIRNKRRRLLLHAPNAVIAMQLAYIANGVLCLTLFQDDWKSGAYITLATVVVYLTQITFVSSRRFTATAR